MADHATPLLIVTNAGIAAANAASPEGPWVHITSFVIGSAYGYDPQKIPFDTSIDGDQLYKGTPTAYRNIGDNTLDVVLTLPADAGPFEFGEIALMNKDGNGQEQLFAKAVFDSPQIKYSSLGTNVASSYTIHALIKLEQSMTIFKIDTVTNNAVAEVDRWSDVVVPYLSAYPDTPLLLVRELDGKGRSSLLHYSVPTEEKWTIGTNYEYLFSSTITNSGTDTIRIPATDVRDTYYSSQNTKYVVEIEGRNDPYRCCASLLKQGNDAVFTINPAVFADLPTTGSPIHVYESKSYKTLPLATNTLTGISRAGSGLNITTPGVMETYGLLHGVQNSGRILSSSDNLSANPTVPGILTSGIYALVSTSMPSGMVPGLLWPGHVEIKNFGTNSSNGTHVCHMIYYPAGTGGTGDANGKNGYPPYWRSWITTGSGTGYWSSWFPFNVRDKRPVGAAGLSYYTLAGSARSSGGTGGGPPQYFDQSWYIPESMTLKATATATVGALSVASLTGAMYIDGTVILSGSAAPFTPWTVSGSSQDYQVVVPGGSYLRIYIDAGYASGDLNRILINMTAYLWRV